MSETRSLPRNPLVNPPRSGRWIIVSEFNPHRIDIYEDGKQVKQITSFSTGGQWKGVWHHTPEGRCTVKMKDRDHHSSLYHNAPMPFYVNFAHAVGFHGGDPNKVSHGCVHLAQPDAEWVFNWSDIHRFTIHVWVLERPKAHPHR